MFSGGKDSLTVLNLVKEVYNEKGITTPVNVVFRDEELIPMSVINFLDEYRRKDWVKMLWFAIPLKSTKYILGRTFDYVQWDPNREHVRTIPEWAITLPPGDDTVLSQFTADGFIAKYFKGKIAFLTGIRADESLMRYRSVVNKLNENYICQPVNYEATSDVNKHVRVVKPIYDWTVDDIFLYLGTRDIKYCPLYDAELYAGGQLRVATPLIAESAKTFDRLKYIDPELYENVIRVFPEMRAHERYLHDIDRQAIIDRYSGSFEGIRSYIEDNITDEHQYALAMMRLEQVESLSKNSPQSYPLDYVLGAFMSGHYKRVILPLAVGEKEKK
jgi:predicted phosphoadenosine phosphosulfate sulfurtransferase